jgi:predicted DNA-binding transcriptional regulator YafY
MTESKYSKTLQVLSLLRQYDGVTISELMKKLECSRSTVERILQNLESSNFKLHREWFPGDDHRILRWSLAKEGLLSHPGSAQLYSFSLEERISLERAYRSDGDPALKDALAKVLALQDALPRASSLEVDALVSRDLRASSVGPKQRIDPEMMQTLSAAMVARRLVLLSYQGGKARSVQPQGLVHSRFQYLVGRSEDGEVRTFRLDLITSLMGTDQMFDEPEDWSLERWAQESFGIYHSDELINVTLEFDAEVADRAERLVFHPTQYQQRLPDGALLVKLRCKGHRELLHEVLHPDWLGHVKVLGPPVLVQELGEFLRITQKKHGLS